MHRNHYTTNFVVPLKSKARHDAKVSGDEVYLAVVRKRVREARRETGLSQEQVAERVDVTLRHYQRYEAKVPPGFNASLLTLRVIGKVLKVDITSLVREPSPEELAEVEGLS